MDSIQIEHFYLGCLAHASYLVGSGSVAAVIDPQRDVDIYLGAAAENGLRIEHVIETHLHADFVSGHRELAERTGAKIYLGEGSGATFPHIAMRDGDSVQFGDCRLEFRQTPGHTVESVSIVMTDLTQPDRPRAVFTGDTLFVGDVGRPDLSADHTPQQLASLLYSSLHEKLLKLPDETEVFPAHGAGSLCGRQMGPERSSTIGKERRSNYALQARSEEEFVHLLTDSLPPRPEYFGKEVELNRHGAAPLEDLPTLSAIRAPEVRKLQSEGVVLLDTRPPLAFSIGHIPASIHVALSGQFASWAARIVGLDTRIVIVGEDADHIRKSQLRLARVGIERLEGYLEDGITGWVLAGYPLDYIPQISAHELAELLEKEPGHITVLDVRETGERSDGIVGHSISIPLGQLAERAGELDKGNLVVAHCKGGYRSSIAASILRRSGFRDIANLTGGYDAWAIRLRAVP
jgi:hydroxyacylglutathione hydrolase